MTAVPEQAPNRHLRLGSSAAGLPVGVVPATVRAGREHGGPATGVTGPRELRRSAPVVPPRWEDLGPPCGGVLLAAEDVPERLGADAVQVQVDALLLSLPAALGTGHRDSLVLVTTVGPSIGHETAPGCSCCCHRCYQVVGPLVQRPWQGRAHWASCSMMR
jgi:hypothetical protein